MHVYQAVTGFLCSVRVPPPSLSFCLSIIDNTNLSTDIECNSAAAINNIARREVRGVQNFPFSARVLIHFIKWMSCSGWFHSLGYYEGYLHVRPVSVSGNHVGCCSLGTARHCSALGGGRRHSSFATLLYCHLYFPLAVAMLYVPISRDVFHLPATAIASATATEYAKWGCQWACNSQLILIRGHTHMNTCKGGGFSL